MHPASLIGSLASVLCIALPAQTVHGDADVTNIQQIRLLASQTPTESYSFHLKGDVWWANPASGNIVLKDDSGAAQLELDLNGMAIEAGQTISLEGDGTITRTGAAFKIGNKGPVVDNDGVHGMVEKSGAVFLKAGRNPIRVEWFNGVEKYGLEVDYKAPGAPREKIPDSALFRLDSASNWVHGLNYKCVEVPGEILPDFNSSAALAKGDVKNFDLSVIPHPEHVGISFTDFLEVPRDGLYFFYTTSDDGSRLFAGEPSLRANIVGRAAFPKAQPMVIGESGDDGQWGTAEGKVTFVSEEPDGLKLELSARTGHISVSVPGGSGLTSAVLLNRQVRATGFSPPSLSFGAASPPSLRFGAASPPSLRFGAASPPSLRFGATSPPSLRFGETSPSILLVPGREEIELMEPQTEADETTGTNAAGLPLLVNASDIHRLKREEAQRGYPVKIRGVVTSVLPEHQAFTIQDSTRGIYVVDFSESRSEPARIGEFLEVEGTTDPSLFAPVVNARHVETLGAGDLPEPIHPTHDQLMNGSLDAQYVEIEGILTSVQDDGVTLLTADGRIKADLRVAGLTTHDLARYEDALIRVRGCLFATWDYVTHRVKVDEIRINGGAVTVEQPAPADLFAIPRKKASELLLFDPQAGVFQRVKVSGEIIYAGTSESFMMDGSNGVRFVSKHPADLQAGDLVDVVGFPELGSASPVLREAVVRKTGHADLPKARVLGADDLVRPEMDSTRVRIKALLVNQRAGPAGESLEMRVGLRSFLALLPDVSRELRDIPEGSQLELTGTWVVQHVSQDVASFELLLNSPSDVAVLARPPWWTLQRMLFILGALACVLAITVLWISQLRRKVEQRGAELEAQIRERQRVEQQHAMEQERARIAQDLHDELGSGLTEITMLGARARSNSRNGHLDQMADKARQMVTALDEIVWAMNPTHDSLASMVSYFSLYAERFLGLANIAWRLEGPFKTDDHAVDSRHRHELFLAFKEALTNVVRHSGATEVRLNIQVEHEQVRLTIADNGRGWAGTGQTEEMDGVANMRARMGKLGGKFQVDTRSGQGTVVRFDLPLN